MGSSLWLDGDRLTGDGEIVKGERGVYLQGNAGSAQFSILD